MSSEPGPGAGLSPMSFGPGRGAFSKRARRAVAVALCVLVAATVLLGAVLLITSKPAAPRLVTIPRADRSASAALLRAAEAVGFGPTSLSGAGVVEGEPITAADPSAAALLPVGALAPRFTLRTATGAPLSLSALRGKAVLLEFFATWCPHCDAEAPHLARLAASLARSRYALVAVNADGETAPSVLAYHIYFGLGFPALLDPSAHPGSFHRAGSAGKVSSAYRVRSYPTFYVLGPSGRIVWGGVGEQPDLLLRDELRKAARASAAGSG